MIKIENTEVFGWEGALRGMRNPLNSWSRSDSDYIYTFTNPDDMKSYYAKCPKLGPNDLNLMKRLVNAGAEHRKFMRMIHVQFDVTAPLYWWKEADTAKVATVRNSCSTMHKIQAKRFTLDDFSHEHLQMPMLEILKHTIHGLNDSRDAYLNSKDKLMWWQMIQLLPSSYNQRATLDMNYETLYSIYHQRKNHKLDEWHTFCDWVETLPYMEELLNG